MTVGAITKKPYQPPRITVDTGCVLSKLLKQNGQFANAIAFLRLAIATRNVVILPAPLFSAVKTRELFQEVVLKGFCPVNEGGPGKYYGRQHLSWLEWEDLIKNINGGYAIMMIHVRNRASGSNISRFLDHAADQLMQLKITEDYLRYFPGELPEQTSSSN